MHYIAFIGYDYIAIQTLSPICQIISKKKIELSLIHHNLIITHCLLYGGFFIVLFLILLPVALTSIIGMVSNSFPCIMRTKTPSTCIQTVFIICMNHNIKKVLSEMTINYVLYATQ